MLRKCYNKLQLLPKFNLALIDYVKSYHELFNKVCYT